MYDRQSNNYQNNIVFLIQNDVDKTKNNDNQHFDAFMKRREQNLHRKLSNEQADQAIYNA